MESSDPWVKSTYHFAQSEHPPPLSRYATSFRFISSFAASLYISSILSSSDPRFLLIGCNLKMVTEKDRARAGLSDSYAKVKMAVLSAPVSFPKVRMMAAKR